MNSTIEGDDGREVVTRQKAAVISASPQNDAAGIVAIGLLCSYLLFADIQTRPLQATIYSWATTLTTLLLVRIVACTKFARHDAYLHDTNQVARFMVFMSWSSVTCAAMWGAAAWVFIPTGSAQADALVIAAISIIMFGGSGACAPYRPYLRNFALTICLIFAAGLLRIQGDFYLALAVGFVLLSFVVLNYGRTQEKTLKIAIQTSLMNERLLNDRIAQQRIIEAESLAADLARNQAEKRLQQYLDAQEAALAEIRSLREAAEADRVARLKFVRDILHDLRSPLGGMGVALDNCQMARQRGRSDLESQAWQHLIGVHHMISSLSADLFDLARFEQRDAPRELKVVEVSKVVGGAVSALSHVAHGKQIDLRTYFTSDARSACKTDESLLFRMVANLLANAIKFTSSKASRASGVVVGVVARDEWVCIHVWDSGVGIAASRMSQVWEYGETTIGTAKEPGFGVGLPMVRAICESLDGHWIDVKSIEGRGTHFRLHLPRLSS